ncbi:MAG: hypothetical protein AB9882_15665 [Ignavibacteriaceae bacterium]
MSVSLSKLLFTSAAFLFGSFLSVLRSEYFIAFISLLFTSLFLAVAFISGEKTSSRSGSY